MSGWWAVYPFLFYYACLVLLNKILSYKFFLGLLFVESTPPTYWNDCL